MPCTGYEPNDGYYEKRMRFAEGALCAVLSVHAKKNIDMDVIARIDEEESGIRSFDLARWWSNHKKEDEQRRKAEAEALEKEEKRKQALSKLTSEERALLGLTRR